MTKLYTIIVLSLVSLYTFANAQVIANINGDDITKDDLRKTAQQMMAGNFSEDVLDPNSPVYGRLLDVVLQRRLVVQQALTSNLEQQAHVQKELQTVREMVLADAYISQEVDKNISDDTLRAEYKKFIAEYKAEQEVHASHILLKTEQEAIDIIKRIEQGEEFAALATAHSLDPGAANGGDLGYFGKGRMVPAFEQAAFSLNAGEYTLDAVQTQFGWHIILVHDKRQSTPPKFAEMRDNLKQQLTHQYVQNLLRDLSAKATVKIADEQGNLTTWQGLGQQ